MSTKKNQEVTEKINTEKNALATTVERPVSETATHPAPREASQPVITYHITSPEETKHLANDLARFIRENKLYHNIQGKEYVNVEGWQYAGCRLGILPVVEDLSQLLGADEGEVRYQAKVKLLDLRTSQIIGSGFAICSNRESSKKYFQEFAIASMAQTRAIGKAYRNILAWIIRAAGYEPTPAEEMDFAVTVQSPNSAAAGASNSRTGTENGSETSVKPAATATRNTPVAVPANALDAKPSTAQRDTAQGDAVPPITINQKTQILLLLNNSVITKEEKERMVSKINTFDAERAEQAIAKLKKVIKERGHNGDSTSGMAA